MQTLHFTLMITFHHHYFLAILILVTIFSLKPTQMCKAWFLVQLCKSVRVLIVLSEVYIHTHPVNSKFVLHQPKTPQRH